MRELQREELEENKLEIILVLVIYGVLPTFPIKPTLREQLVGNVGNTPIV